jgi:hypothetical protein
LNYFKAQGGLAAKISEICWIYDLFIKGKMCGLIPRVCGPATFSVHHGPEQWSSGGLARAHARGRSVSGSSPPVGEKGEELWGVLNEGTKGWHSSGIGWQMGVSGHVFWSREVRKE